MDRIIDVFPAERQNQVRSMLSNSLKAVISQSLCKKIGGGRVAALEILKVDHGISALIRDGKIHQIPSAMQVGGAKGMKLLNAALGELVQAGTISQEEGYLKAVDKEGYEKMVSRRGGTAPGAGSGAGPMAEATVSSGAGPSPRVTSSAPKKKRGLFSS